MQYSHDLNQISYQTQGIKHLLLNQTFDAIIICFHHTGAPNRCCERAGRIHEYLSYCEFLPCYFNKQDRRLLYLMVTDAQLILSAF